MTGRRNVGLNVHRNLDGFIKDGKEGWGWEGGGRIEYLCNAPPNRSDPRKHAPKTATLVALRPGTETVGLLETGAQDVHLDFHTAPEHLRMSPSGIYTLDGRHTPRHRCARV